MILTATPKNDGSVKLQTDIAANYDVYRSANGSTFAKIGSIANGTQFIDYRPNKNWKFFDSTNITLIGSGSTVGDSFELAFTGRQIAILGWQYGMYGNQDGLKASIYEDDVYTDFMSMSSDQSSAGQGWDFVPLWAKDYGTVTTKTIKGVLSTKNMSSGSMLIDGYWLDTGEQVIELGKTGFYKLINTDTQEAKTVTAAPIIKYRERLGEMFEEWLAYQLTQPNQTINPGYTPYRMTHVLPFAFAYSVTQDQRFKDAAYRQFTYAQSLRDAQGRIPYIQSNGVSLYHEDYNARHANGAYWCYKIFGDIAFLREAEATAQGAINSYGGKSATYNGVTYSPLCSYASWTLDAQDWPGSVGNMFANLWAEPNSVYYHNSTYFNYAKAQLSYWMTFIDQATGQIFFNRTDGKYPDGVYSQFALINTWNASKVFRNADNSENVPGLWAAVLRAMPWETKTAIEPRGIYSSKYHGGIGITGTQRIPFAYELAQAGQFSYDDWADIFSVWFTPSAGINVPANYTGVGSVGVGYYPSGGFPHATDGQSLWNSFAFNFGYGTAISAAMGVPSEWYAPATLIAEPPPVAIEEPMYFGAPFGGYFGQETVSTATAIELSATGTINIPGTINMTINAVISATPIQLSASGTINIPASVSMGMYSAAPATALELAVSGTIDIPASVKMRIIKLMVNLHKTSIYRFKEIPDQYTVDEIPNRYNSKEIPNQYVCKELMKLYQYTLGETKPVQLQWSRKDGKDFTITSAIYTFEEFIEEQMSIDGKTTLVNLTPTSIGTKYCTCEVELTAIDSTLPVEVHIEEPQIKVTRPKGVSA